MVVINYSDCDDSEQTSGTSVLCVTDLCAGYAGQRNAILDVNFEVNKGELIGVIGPNGAGKSTLFKALVGIIPHSAGVVSVKSADCASSHQMIGYVSQYDEVNWQFPATVFDVVMMGRARKIGWFRFPSRRDREAVNAALEQVGMLHLSSRQISELSGGQKRRVFIARTLAQETDLLLLDEPFTGVDPAAEDDIMETLERLNQSGITLMISTHDLNRAATTFDRLIMLNQTVIAVGAPEDVLTTDLLKHAYGGLISVLPNTTDRPALIISDLHIG